MLRRFSLLTLLFISAFLMVLSSFSISFSWTKMPGVAVDIAASPDGDLYVLGSNREIGGYAIYKWQENGWLKMPGGGMVIAAGNNGVLWTIDARGLIYRFSSGGWQQMQGLASDISVGGDGSVWIIGKNSCDSGNSVYKLGLGGGWEQVEGCASSIKVDRNGKPWVINNVGSTFKLENDTWVPVDGKNTKYAFDLDNKPWAISDSFCSSGGGKIYSFSAGSWVEHEGCGRDIAITSNGDFYLINGQNEVYQY